MGTNYDDFRDSDRAAREGRKLAESRHRPRKWIVVVVVVLAAISYALLS